MGVRLLISICHPLVLVSCNDRMGVDYATTLTQVLLKCLLVTVCDVFPTPASLFPFPIPIPMHITTVNLCTVCRRRYITLMKNHKLGNRMENLPLNTCRY